MGDPVPVTRAGEDQLTYRLSGDGHTDFEVVSVAAGGQIRVASGAVVDYETRAAYDLVLTVSDGKNREGDDDQLRVDSAIAVKITLEDEFEPELLSVTASVSPDTQSSSGPVVFTATAHNLPDGVDRWFDLQTADSDGNAEYVLTGTSVSDMQVTATMHYSAGRTGTRYYVVSLTVIHNDIQTTVYSDLLTVHWQ